MLSLRLYPGLHYSFSLSLFLSRGLSVILLRSLLVPVSIPSSLLSAQSRYDTTKCTGSNFDGGSQTTRSSLLYFLYFCHFPHLILLSLPHFPTLFSFSLGIGTQKWIWTPSWSKTLRLSRGSHFACQRRSFGFHLAGSGPAFVFSSCRNTRLYPTLPSTFLFPLPFLLTTTSSCSTFLPFIYDLLPVLSFSPPLSLLFFLPFGVLGTPFPRYSLCLYRAFCQALTPSSYSGRHHSLHETQRCPFEFLL